jgi:hypothetical protein
MASKAGLRRLHLPEGTAAPNTAPLKFTAGTVLATLENGAVEYDGAHFYGTAEGTRWQLDRQAVAGEVTVDTTDFDHILSDADSVLGAALDTLDDHTHSADEITVPEDAFDGYCGGNSTDVLEALQALDEHVHSSATNSIVSYISSVDYSVVSSVSFFSFSVVSAVSADSSSLACADASIVTRFSGADSTLACADASIATRLSTLECTDASSTSTLTCADASVVTRFSNADSTLTCADASLATRISSLEAGASGAAVQTIIVPVTYSNMGGSVSSTATIPNGAKIDRVSVYVSTAFSGGSAPTLAAIVDGTTDTTLLTTGQTNLAIAQQYEFWDLFAIDAAGKSGVVKVTMGGTANAGSAYVMVWYSTPAS